MSAPESPPTVALVDSGIGGLTIAAEIRKRLPGLRIHYTADLAAFPYGNLDADRIFQRLSHITQQVLRTHQPKIVVIACNTASTQVLDRLRDAFAVPFVGVVPAIKPAASLTRSGHILLLATPGTAKSRYLEDLIAQFSNGHRVHIQGSSTLVTLAERKLATGEHVQLDDLRSAIPAHSEAVDTAVLACTHFPILKPDLTEAFPRIHHWVDSGEAIARRVDSLLSDAGCAYRVGTSDSIKNVFLYTGQKKAPYLLAAIEQRLGRFDEERLDL